MRDSLRQAEPQNQLSILIEQAIIIDGIYFHCSASRRRIPVMAVIRLPRTSIESSGDEIIVRHLRTGVSVSVSASRLDTWCVSQLRAMISSPAAAGFDRGPGAQEPKPSKPR
jgi:hypothetical protein